jgi:CBS-domain-containing membrane protein
MQMLHALHPPAGATAVFAVIGGTAITDLGYWFVIVPILAGMVILVLSALVINNAFKSPSHHYPTHWL